jgi:hypothetical protein
MLLLLQQRSSCEDTGAHNCNLLLGFVGSNNHGLEFLLKLDGLDNLSIIVLGH